MAGVADKARFYLERSVPQLREWEEKEIFSKDEIRSIVQRRSDFEHRVLAPGANPSEFSAYAAWEINLDALRAKRCERLKIRHVASQHATQARVLAIYERAVGKRPACKELWLEYLEYTAKIKATKRWRKTMTRALRLMPRDADLWVLAGQKAADNGDMTSARAYFMRGCRFCTADEVLWIEYARCEMQWLDKLERKKRKDGKKGGQNGQNGQKPAALAAEQVDESDEIQFNYDEDEADEDGLILPESTVGKEAAPPVFDKKTEDALENNPAMDGAIPRAIFDVARKQPFYSDRVAERFFDLFAAFTAVSVQNKMLQHVFDAMVQEYEASPATWSCYIRMPLVGVSPFSAAFPRGLREALSRLSKGLESTADPAALRQNTVAWIDPVLALADLDEGIRVVLEHTKGKLQA
ncbi:U3 small nucleolar RNA-associated protein 6 [Sodiomyces alkalinus F11]|uniref:U3 small nucleolar RNA-associated protein 6 n=1 Tax=Sodiomyces alkalinus (strain CBS 110278 / VKM F-3762 / F11) TaxID=1314773 RepID=A0A3N2PV73_SODAK|nr:U3 small nucleolar RNA-associated protein 6 [Sodiomyces alkalinus F11]ROT38407.1 U3 small nucleolar RNA-associated protein 6 [Sodiomyces alkalinus F11]